MRCRAPVAAPPSFALVLACASAAWGAGLTPVSQDRQVSADVTVGRSLWTPDSNPFFPDFDPPDATDQFPNPAQETASDFGVFDESVGSIDAPETLDLLDASVDAAQTSEIGADRITASGSWQTSLDSDSTTLPGPPLIPYDFLIDGTTGDGASHFSVTFQVDAKSRFALTGLLDHTYDDFSNGPFGYVDGAATARLTGPGGVIAEFDTRYVQCEPFPECLCEPLPECLDAPLPIDVQGTLDPGTYTLEADAGGTGQATCADVGGGLTCFMPTGNGSYDVELLLLPLVVPAVGPAGAFVLALGLLVAGGGRLRHASRSG